MNTTIFQGKKFYIISSKDTEIKSILIECGAINQTYLSGSASFAIADNSNESEVGEADDLYDVPVVTSEWVRLCLQWGQLQFMKAFHPSIRNLFENLCFFIVNINTDDTEKLIGYIKIYGGSVMNMLTSDVTHVVIGVIEGEVYDKILSQCPESTAVVTPNWVIESINSKTVKHVGPFHPQVLVDRLKQLLISSETERLSQSKRAVPATTFEQPIKKTVTETPVVVSAPQFNLSGLQQAVPISIQDSLLTRQLPSAVIRQEHSVYPPCRPTLPTRTSVPTSVTVPPVAVPTQAPLVKNKTSKSTNKHLQEQGLNESEKEAIVQQNLMSILGQSHSRRAPTTSGSSEKNTTSVTNKKPRSPRLKNSPKTSSIPSSASQSSVSTSLSLASNTGSMAVSNQGNIKSVVTQSSSLSNAPIIQLNSTALPQTQMIPSIVSTPMTTTALPSESKIDPISPKIDHNLMRPILQQQIISNQNNNQNISNVPRPYMVCGINSSSTPQTVSSRPQTLGQENHDKIVYNPGNMCSTSSSVPTQQLIVQQGTAQTQSLFPRQPQRHMPQQQQPQQQQQQQQQKQLIALSQIQAPNHQIQQHWSNAVHMSPNQHASSAILSPSGICATVTGTGMQQGGQMYQLTNQQTNYYRWMQQLTRSGILNNGNPIMLNNLGNGMPINAPCASMVTNVAAPIHLQSPVGNGNPATLMLHQQQLHVAGNLTSSMQSPNNGSGNQNLGLTPGKIMANSSNRSILQHPSQIPAGVRVANPSYPVLQPSNQGMSSSGASNEHGHHPNGGHLSRPFPGILRLPQYVGHEGMTSGICRENCLIGCVFYLYGYEDVSQVKRDNWLSAIRSHGGETVNVCNFQIVTHLIVDCQLEDPDLFKLSLRNKTRVVTIYWVNDVIEKGHLEPPFEIIHLPSPFSKNLSFSYIRKQIVSITGFEGEERKKVEYMVIQLGVKYTEYLEASNTVLICKKPSGRKYDAAQKLGIACVNVRWLQDLYFGDLQTLSNDIDHKYQCFEPSYVSIRLERHTHRVQELMVGWLIPMRLDDNSWKKLRLLKDQYEAEKNSKKRQAEVNALQSPINSKKPKDRHFLARRMRTLILHFSLWFDSLIWELPSLSDEDKKLADSTPCKYSKPQPHVKIENGVEMDIKTEQKTESVDEFLEQHETFPQVVVAFTGLVPEQRDKLSDLVISLGGEVTEDMNRFTHLVTKNIVRTPKFYFAILRGCHIVTLKWIQACAYKEQFIDENPWRLEDKEGERQYGFSLQESLLRAQKRQMNHSRPLFDSLEFFLSPRAKHRQVCIDLIRACGGTIREKRPIQKMALMAEPKHLIICHEDDSHLANYLTRTKTGNKAVHHEEFVLSGVMRQELDYDSYQIQYVSVMKNAFNNHTMQGSTEFVSSSVHQQESVHGKDSPSRSAMSDSTVDTIDTQTSQSELSSLPQTTKTQSIFDPNSFIIKSEPTTADKFIDANIFSKIGYPSAHSSSSFSTLSNNSHNNTNNQATTALSTDQFITNSVSETKVEESFFQSNNNGEQLVHPSFSAAEAIVLDCKDQIVSISPSKQEVFGMKVDESTVNANNAISCSMVPINMAPSSNMQSVSPTES